MVTFSLDFAKKDLESVVRQVLTSAEPAVVNTPADGSVVVLPLAEFESWQETCYLLNSSANAAHLRKSIAEAQQGETSEHELLN